MNKQEYAITLNIFSRKVQLKLDKLKIPASTTMTMRKAGPHVGLYAGKKWITWLTQIEIALMQTMGVDHDNKRN